MKRTALITGANGGLGREFARICAVDKCDLVLSGRNEEELLELKTSLEEEYDVNVKICIADLSEEDGAWKIREFTEERDIDVDILINNAGFGYSGAFADGDYEREQDLLQVNILSLVKLTRYYLAPMLERGYGRILNVASAASFCAGPYMALYYASKAFVRSFSEGLSEEVRGTGVSVTALCPGPTETGFEKTAFGKTGTVMFIKAAEAADVAMSGIRAMKKGKALCYPDLFVRAASLGEKFLPRCVMRRMAGKINH